MIASIQYREDMTAQERADFPAARDASIDIMLSMAVDLAVRDGMDKAPPQGMINPLGQPARVTSPVDPKREHPLSGEIRPHNGTDFAPNNRSRQSAVLAAADGYVIYSGVYSKPAGQTVLIYHPNGPDGGYVTGYMHLRDGSLTARDLGSRVAQGERLGDMSNTGVGTAPHLHFVVRKLNPRPSDLPVPHSVPQAQTQTRVSDDGGPVTITSVPVDSARVFSSYIVVRPTINGVLYSSSTQRNDSPVAWIPPTSWLENPSPSLPIIVPPLPKRAPVDGPAPNASNTPASITMFSPTTPQGLPVAPSDALPSPLPTNPAPVHGAKPPGNFR